MRAYELVQSAVLILVLTGCAVTIPSTPPPPAYHVTHRIVQSGSLSYHVQISTRATNCPFPRKPALVVERLELFSPEGRLLRVMDKWPAPTGPGSYVGRFSIDMPATAPAGTYGVTIALSLNGRRCAAHQGTLHHRGGNSDSNRASAGD